MRMNITYTGFIADVRRVIAVIKISQPIVTAQNFPTTWNPIPPTLHAEHIKKYLFFYCLLCFKSNWCPYNFLRAIHEAWPLRLCVWILSTRFNKSMVSSSQNEQVQRNLLVVSSLQTLRLCPEIGRGRWLSPRPDISQDPSDQQSSLSRSQTHSRHSSHRIMMTPWSG